MRLIFLLPIPLLCLACAWRGPGADPTRYPWDQRKASYCIVSLEQPGASGITSGSGSVELACKPPARGPKR